jgi:predicted small lipoprotein YifL
MKRVIYLFGILSLASVLAGCDKCGNFGPFFTGPEQKTCSSSTPSG